jgi:hypothetical protein
MKKRQNCKHLLRASCRKALPKKKKKKKLPWCTYFRHQTNGHILSFLGFMGQNIDQLRNVNPAAQSTSLLLELMLWSNFADRCILRIDLHKLRLKLARRISKSPVVHLAGEPWTLLLLCHWLRMAHHSISSSALTQHIHTLLNGDRYQS